MSGLAALLLLVATPGQAVPSERVLFLYTGAVNFWFNYEARCIDDAERRRIVAIYARFHAIEAVLTARYGEQDVEIFNRGAIRQRPWPCDDVAETRELDLFDSQVGELEAELRLP